MVMRCTILKIELSHWYPEDRINPSSRSTHCACCRQIMVYCERSREYDKQLDTHFNVHCPHTLDFSRLLIKMNQCELILHENPNNINTATMVNDFM